MKKIEIIKNCIDVVNNGLESIVDSYNPHVKHFEIGDEVYYIPNYSDVVTAKIDEIDDFSENGTKPGGMIYYWIIPEGCRITIWNKINFWLNGLFPRLIKHRLPRGFPGHSVAAGIDIFKTRREAKLAVALNNCFYDLEMLIHEFRDQ